MTCMKRALALLLCLCALATFALAEEAAETEAPARDAETEKLLEDFTLKHGSREKKMVAFTVDDCYQERRQFIEQDVALCNQYGIHMTFFPIYKTGCLQERYRDIWQRLLDADQAPGPLAGRTGQDAGLPLPDPVDPPALRLARGRQENEQETGYERPETLRV